MRVQLRDLKELLRWAEMFKDVERRFALYTNVTGKDPHVVAIIRPVVASRVDTAFVDVTYEEPGQMEADEKELGPMLTRFREAGHLFTIQSYEWREDA